MGIFGNGQRIGCLRTRIYRIFKTEADTIHVKNRDEDFNALFINLNYH